MQKFKFKIASKVKIGAHLLDMWMDLRMWIFNGAKKLSIMTFSIRTLSIIIKETRHSAKWHSMQIVVMLSAAKSTLRWMSLWWLSLHLLNSYWTHRRLWALASTLPKWWRKCLLLLWILRWKVRAYRQSSWSKGISETNLKL